MMMRTATFFAAVVLFAAALFFAAPAAAQEVQPATVGCSEAEHVPWRLPHPSALPAGVYDFTARSDDPTDEVGLLVEQYAGGDAWTTRLSTFPADNPAPYATGTVSLQGGRWTDVYARCVGGGEVTLTVSRRASFELYPVSGGHGAGQIQNGPFSIPCHGLDFNYETAYQFVTPYSALHDFAMDGDARVVVFYDDAPDQKNSLDSSAYNGALHATVHIAVDRLATAVFLCGGQDETTVTVTRREPVELRRLR